MGKVNQQPAVPWMKDVKRFQRKQKALYKLARKTIDDINREKEGLVARLEELNAALEVAKEMGVDSA